MQEMSREMMKAGIIEEMLEEAIDQDVDEELEEEVQTEVDKVLFELVGGSYLIYLIYLRTRFVPVKCGLSVLVSYV